jgi:MFS family permease
MTRVPAAPGETEARPENAAPSRPPSLWRNSDYVGWWVGNTVSALGTSVSTIAYTLLVLALTGSVTQAGLIGSVNLAGVLVTTLWGGALADRVSRRAILVIGPLVQGVVLGTVAVLVADGAARLPLLLAASALSGLSSGVVLGSSTPALRRIVPREQLPTANGQAMGRDMAAQLLGSPLGGVLFALSSWLPFGADAVSFVFAALGALHIRRPLGPDRDEQHKAPLLKDVAAGIGFVRSQPFLRFVVVAASLLNMIGQAFLLLLIALVRHRGGGPATIGLVSSMIVAGGLVGSILAPAIVKALRARTVLYLALWPFTAAVAVVAVLPRPWEMAVAVCLAEVAAVPVNVVLQSYVARAVPDRLLGRVAAVNRFGAYGLEWLGPLLAGGLAALFGPEGGMLALLVLLVPLAISLHLSRGLAILEIPLDQVAELPAPESTLRPGPPTENRSV